MAGLTLGACATTKPAMEVQVRPVLEASGSAKQQDFNAESALAAAQKLQRASDYKASFNAFNVLLMRMERSEDKRDIRADVMLGLADTALSLSWFGEKYETRAREIYTRIYEADDSSEDHKRRAENGLLLLDFSGLEPDEIETRLRLALKDSADDPRLWNALGKLHDDNTNWLDALDAYVQALAAAKKKDASTAAVVNNMGMSLLMQGRKKEALSKFKQARKANPDMPVYDNNLRLAQTLSGKTNAAVKGLSETRAAQIYNDAGVIAQAQGKSRKARRFYKKAIEKSPIYFEVAEKNLAGLLSDAKPDKADNSPA
jgi:tetratricopeptide (TPR) repeat protein